MGGGASKGKRGPVDKAAPAKGVNQKPRGFDVKGAPPMAKATGNKKMNRVLKGVDKKKGGKSVVVSDKSNKLSGKYF